MPKVHYVKARSDYPPNIKKGDMHYVWSFFRQKPTRSLTRPRPSQLVNSPTHSAALAIAEDLQDAVDAASTIAEVKQALEDASSAADEVMNDYDEKISNLEEAFQGGCPALEDAQEQRDAVELFKDECDSLASDLEDDGDFDDAKEAAQSIGIEL